MNTHQGYRNSLADSMTGDATKYNLRCNRNISEKMTKKDFVYDIRPPIQNSRKVSCGSVHCRWSSFLPTYLYSVHKTLPLACFNREFVRKSDMKRISLTNMYKAIEHRENIWNEGDATGTSQYGVTFTRGKFTTNNETNTTKF